MKVLFCTPAYVSFVRGGILSVVASLRRTLERAGVQVEFLSPSEPIDSGNYDILHIFSSVASFDLFFIADYASKMRMKVVFNPIIYGKWPPWVVRTEIALLKHVPHLYNWHVCLKKVLDLSDAITPNTRAEADYISKAYSIPLGDLHIIPNGVDDRFMHGDPELIRQRTGFRDFVLTVGYVGARKNQLRVLAAAEHLGLPFVSIGKIQDDVYCREFLKRVGARKDVCILDQLPSDDPLLASAYVAASVFVLASWWETPGLAALEAALAGTPVVITPVGGTRDYFGDLVEYVDSNSIESIRHGIERALARTRDERLREHVRTNYTWSNVGQKIIGLYRSLGAA